LSNRVQQPSGWHREGRIPRPYRRGILLLYGQSERVLCIVRRWKSQEPPERGQLCPSTRDSRRPGDAGIGLPEDHHGGRHSCWRAWRAASGWRAIVSSHRSYSSSLQRPSRRRSLRAIARSWPSTRSSPSGPASLHRRRCRLPSYETAARFEDLPTRSRSLDCRNRNSCSWTRCWSSTTSRTGSRSAATLSERNIEKSYQEAVHRIDALVDRLRNAHAHHEAARLVRRQRQSIVDFSGRTSRPASRQIKEYVTAASQSQCSCSAFRQGDPCRHADIYPLPTISPSPTCFSPIWGILHHRRLARRYLGWRGSLITRPLQVPAAGQDPRRMTGWSRSAQREKERRAYHLVDLAERHRPSERTGRWKSANDGIEKYSLMHLVTHVQGKLRQNTPFDSLGLLPGGTFPALPRYAPCR